MVSFACTLPFAPACSLLCVVCSFFVQSDWSGGVYTLSMTFPEDYPNKPPKVRHRLALLHQIHVAGCYWKRGLHLADGAGVTPHLVADDDVANLLGHTYTNSSASPWHLLTQRVAVLAV